MKHNRVLVFSTDDHLYPAGGAEQAFGHIAARMPEVTFDLICARLRRSASVFEVRDNVRIHRIGFGISHIDGFLLALFGSIRARRLVRAHTYDLVWSIMASYGAFAAVRIKKMTKLPFLLTLQEGDSLEYIYRKVRYVRRAFAEIFTTADGVQAISTFLLTWGRDMGYRGRYGVIIPNGVDLAKFTQDVAPEDRIRTRASFGFQEGDFVLITSSRLETKNGIRDVVAALALLPPSITLVICGSGSLESALRAQVMELNLTNRVHFLGFVDPSELPRLLASCDAFVRPSLSEGLGNAFLEAMAVGIPVLGTPVGGIPDFLRAGETGYLANVNDPQSVAHAVTAIRAASKEERERIVRTARTMVHERYNWDTIARSMHDFMRTLTQQS